MRRGVVGIFYFVSVWVHLLAAIVWIGGMVFLAAVLVPALRRNEYSFLSASLIQWTGRRFRWVGWLCLVALVLTGFVNLSYRGIGWDALASGELWQTSFGRVLGAKLILLAAILSLSIFHDFVIGPRAANVLREKLQSNEARTLRRQASWIGRINLLLAVAVVALGTMLLRGTPW